MATKKTPMRKPVAKKPVPRNIKVAGSGRQKPAAKKPATRTLTRAESIAMGKGSSAKSRKDFAGTTGFGDTMSSFNKNNNGMGSKYYQSKQDKSAVGYLKSKGLNPDKQGADGATLRGDFRQSNYPKASKKFLGFEHDMGGKKSVNGIPQLWKNSVSKDSYKRIKNAVNQADKKKKKK